MASRVIPGVDLRHVVLLSLEALLAHWHDLPAADVVPLLRDANEELAALADYHQARAQPPAEAARLAAVARIVEGVARAVDAAGKPQAAALRAALDELAWIAGAVRLTVED